MSDENDARTTRLILVPGTWGRGFFKSAIEPEAIISEEFQTTGASTEDDKKRQRLRWFESGSEFWEKLANGLIESRIKFTTRVLLWDGHNSIVSRNKAAIVLADLIRSLAKASNDPIVVIAHSHGGNVALRAVHIAGMESIANLKVVTLATPFLQIYTHTTFREDETPEIPCQASPSSGRSPSDRKVAIDYFPPLGKEALAFLLISVSAVLGLPFAAAILIPLAIYQDALRALFPPTSFIDPFIAAIIAIAVLGIFVGGRLGELVLKKVVNPHAAYRVDPNERLDEWAYRPDHLASLSFYMPPQTRKDWLLVLRGIDDEASLTLAAGSIGNRITHFILGTLLPNIYQILALLATLMAGASAAGWIAPSLGGIIALGYGAAAFLATIILALPGLFRLVFGRELFLGSWRCEIAAASSPDGVDGVQVKTLPGQPEPSKRKLRHALYLNAEVPTCILEWLKADGRESRCRR